MTYKTLSYSQDSLPVGLISEEEIYSVTDLTRSIRFILEEEFPSIWVSGEISNYRVPGSGHAYFILKDKESQIRCILFRGQKRFIRFEPEDGLEVLIRGRLSVYEPRGEYQIIADHIEPRGIGALQLAFEQLKERLFKEGLFNSDRKKTIPEFPERIGIVTSATSAAVMDILNVIQRRFPNIHIQIYPVRVQGDGAAAEIAEGVKIFNETVDIDVMILARGGGSIEDLWAFNEEIVARAIYGSRIPIISAVGHEIDFTISDFVADLRAPTPSAAAEMVVKDKDELLRDIKISRQRLNNNLFNIISNFRETIKSLSTRRVLTDSFARIRDMQQVADDFQTRLGRGMLSVYQRNKDRSEYIVQRLKTQDIKNRIEQSMTVLVELRKHLIGAMTGQARLTGKRFGVLSGRLNALSPLAVLERGYSICRKMPDMQTVRDISIISTGDKVNIKLWAGEMVCEVKKIKKGLGTVT